MTTTSAPPPGAFACVASNGRQHDALPVILLTSFAGVLNQCQHWCLKSAAAISTDNITRSGVMEALRNLFAPPVSIFGRARCFFFIGHGASGTGNWEVTGGAFVSLNDILSLWREYYPITSSATSAILYLYVDACSSGLWVDECKKMARAPDVYLQTSGNDKDCCGGVFTQYWLRAHADDKHAQPVLPYRYVPRTYTPPGSSSIRPNLSGILSVRELLRPKEEREQDDDTRQHKRARTSPVPLETASKSPAAAARTATPLTSPPTPVVATAEEHQYLQWDALQKAAAGDKAGTTEAQFRQAISSKDRTIVALLTDKEDLKLQLEELRKMQFADRVQHVAPVPTATAAVQSELEKQLAHQKTIIDKLKEGIHDAVVCPVCHEPTPVPRVLECGHMVCEPCLKSWDAASNPLPPGVILTAATPQHHTNRKCPLCRALLVGPGYKAFNLRSLTRGLIEHLREHSGKDSKETKDEMNVEYDQDSNERRALIDLRIKYLKQIEMGEFAAQQFALLLTREQQMQGVLVFFHPTCTHAFLQSFGTYLVRVHAYDVQYDMAGRVMTARLLLQATVIVRPELSVATKAAAPAASPATATAMDSNRLAPKLVVASAPPLISNADLYRYGIQVLPDRRIVILPAPPLSASAAPAASTVADADDDDEDDKTPTETEEQKKKKQEEVAKAAHLAPPTAPSLPIEDTIQAGPIPMHVNSSDAAALLAGVRALQAQASS